jgi:hypothetical protein
MEHIEIGGKKMRWTEGQRQVAKSGEWILHSSAISLCGKFQNYKLYRDVAAAPKKVFYLGYDLEKKTLCYIHDMMVMQEHYPHMAEWVLSAINGSVGKAPEFKPWNEIGKEKERKAVGKILTGPVVADMLKLINEQWYTPTPLSIFPQTRKQGRYAPAMIAQKFGVNELDVEATIGHLIYSQVLGHEIRDRSSKIKGLKVIGEVANG